MSEKKNSLNQANGPEPPQVKNPSDEERHALVKYFLNKHNRLGDFKTVIDSLSPPPDITTIAPPGSFKHIKVGIIGAGNAGLAAAFELRKLGFDITLFEANEQRIGGRVYTYYFDKNHYGELGAMRIPVSHETTWHYINLFHLSTRPYIQNNENAFIYAQNERVRNDAKGKGVQEQIYPKFNLTEKERNTPWPELLEHPLEEPLLQMQPNIRKQLSEARKNFDPEILYWDYFNIRQVLEKSGLSREAINLIGSISPFTGSFYYANYIEVLMESYNVSFSYLYEILGGIANLPLSLYNSLLNPNPREYKAIENHLLGNVKVKRGSMVNGIFYDHNQNKVMLKYKNVHIPVEMTEEFDYIVSAIPFSTLRNVEIKPLFSNDKMEAIRELGYNAAQKTLFFTKKRFWEEQGIIGGGSFTDLPISSIWYPSDHADCKDSSGIDPNCSPYKPGVFTASYNFDLNTTRVLNMCEPENSFENVKWQVEKVHGLPKNYLDSIVQDYMLMNWNQNPFSLGAFSYYRPEQKSLFSYAMKTPEYNNRIFFAGEHLSSAHGWMTGALQTGMKAANNIAAMCKQRKE